MNASLSVAVVQGNFTVGAIAANADRIIAAIVATRDLGADLVVTPELALCGYPPEDLLLRPDFYRDCERELTRVVAAAQGICAVVGHPHERDGNCYNAASVLRDGQILVTYHKQLLPNAEVFDEVRYFTAGEAPCVFEVAGVMVGINICEDMWAPRPALLAREAGAQLLLSLNASPYHQGKQAQRYQVVRDRIAETRLPTLYCNMVGGQDELIFDGASFALDDDGALAYQGGSFDERLDMVRFTGGHWQSDQLTCALAPEEEVYEALKMGVRDYIGKNGFPGVLIGLSGGIDSALTLAIAVDALGPERVWAVMMASPYTVQMSFDDARDIAARLKVRYDEIAIMPGMEAFDAMLAPLFADLPSPAGDTSAENLQSRVRGVLLMALSNKTGAIVLTTGNKSEMATGYATLYGDMAGGFAVLKDVYKTFVYRLAEWRNRQSEVIPRNIIERPPSAELKPDQKDQDSLPPYEMLDAIIEAYMERNESPRQIIGRGYPAEEVRRTVTMLKRNEYKRRQAPVGVRVTQRGFGRDWRYPITSRYTGEF